MLFGPGLLFRKLQGFLRGECQPEPFGLFVANLSLSIAAVPKPGGKHCLHRFIDRTEKTFPHPEGKPELFLRQKRLRIQNVQNRVAQSLRVSFRGLPLVLLLVCGLVGFGAGKLLWSVTRRTMPSAFRFPREKGTTTRIPGRRLVSASREAGTRYS